MHILNGKLFLFSGKIKINNNEITVERSNLLNRNDVHNMKTKYGLTKGRKHENDLTSIEIWV